MPNKNWIKYCTKCLIPATRPGQTYDEKGVCNACKEFEFRKQVDWEARDRELDTLLNQYRRTDGYYDCIVPVSGGKDSTCQVIKMLEKGMHPLCVYAAVDKPSDIGKRNLENMRQLGVDLVEVSTNPIARNKMDKISLMEIGDISWAENVAIFTIPVRIAVQMKIPLLIWGENPQNEFGGPKEATHNHILDKRWLEEFGGLLGFENHHVVGREGITEKDMVQFNYPSDEELKVAGVKGVFLGYFVPWDGYAHALLAQGYGFEMWPKSNEGALANYEHMDNLHAGIHDYFKFIKLGFGRATDHASLHIRRGRLSRKHGLEIVKRNDGKFPWTYLETTLEEILDDIDMSFEEFMQTCDKFTNKDLFLTDENGELIRDKGFNLTKINYDNVDEALMEAVDKQEVMSVNY
ncbi:N-acetyl sugar amidotransferase [Patescibacteria group bacterium]|nr:N-acetyl sugar amidotransferase [Patescibacteria group bacterium]MBU1123643.1 N-acetyl sugar amidotransferase [Patescibacteria group bacterium]MBU1911528.1 N-acetyl sugar amidotransferase [Patescibacteria group bacterium]